MSGWDKTARMRETLDAYRSEFPHKAVPSDSEQNMYHVLLKEVETIHATLKSMAIEVARLQQRLNDIQTWNERFKERYPDYKPGARGSLKVDLTTFGDTNKTYLVIDDTDEVFGTFIDAKVKWKAALAENDKWLKALHQSLKNHP